MLDIREALKNIKLSAVEESEVQRLGAEVVAVARDAKGWDGTPIEAKILVGKTESDHKSAWRVVCALKRRFEGDGWAAQYRVENDEYGELYSHSLFFAPDMLAARQKMAPAAAPAPVEAAVAVPAGIKTYDRPVLSVLLGTYNRRELLEEAVASIRQSVGTLPYEIVVADGGSTDGSRQWLAAQPDVVLVGFRHLGGAVHAFNAAHRAARGEFVANLNDDMTVEGDALKRGVEYLRANARCGQVAFEFRGEGENWTVNEVYPGHKTVYANFGIARREIANQIAYITGGLWPVIYHTYAGDTEFSAWVWRLGHTVDALRGSRVRDVRHHDGLRDRNQTRFAVDTKAFYARWSAAAFSPDGPEPRVSERELTRYHEVRDGRWEPASTVEAVPDVVTTMASLCGLPFPEEERRLRRLAPAVRALDPEDGFPQRSALGPERVLHVSLCTDADPQAGLVRALKWLGAGGYEEVRWLADYPYHRDTCDQAIITRAKKLKPTLIFMQLQTRDAVGVDVIKYLREFSDPSCVIVTWNGDIAHDNRPWDTDWQVPMGRLVDLTLHSSMTHVRALRAAGIHTAGYLQIGYDQQQYKPLELPPMLSPIYDVTFLATRYAPEHPLCVEYAWQNGEVAHDGALRDEVVLKMREAFGEHFGFGLFGNGWETLDEKATPVKLSEAHTIYQQSKIGLSVSFDNKLECYSSDRLHRIAGCGALMLVKRFPGMNVWGLKHGENCLVWDTADEAVTLARVFSQPEADERREEIAKAGHELAESAWTWETRMEELSAYIQAVRAAR